jgi:hypothetical protein
MDSLDLSTINYRKLLLDAADRYCKRHGVSLSWLGKELMNDRRFFTGMKEDKRGCTVDTFQYLVKWFEEHEENLNGGGSQLTNKRLTAAKSDRQPKKHQNGMTVL